MCIVANSINSYGRHVRSLKLLISGEPFKLTWLIIGISIVSLMITSFMHIIHSKHLYIYPSINAYKTINCKRSSTQPDPDCHFYFHTSMLFWMNKYEEKHVDNMQKLVSHFDHLESQCGLIQYVLDLFSN